MCFPCFVFSQNVEEEIDSLSSKYKEGYYITNSGEKISGYFKFRHVISLQNIGMNDYNKLKFKKSINEEPIKLKNKEIDSVKIGDDKYFIVKRVKLTDYVTIGGTLHKNILSKIIIDGKISVYQATIHLNTGGSFSEYMEVLFIRKEGDEEYYQVPRGAKKFRNLMSNLMGDQNEFLEEQKLSEKNDKDLIHLVESYNLLFK